MSPSSSRTERFERIDSAEVVRAWQSRFGIGEEAFSGCAFYRRAQSIWAFSEIPLPWLSYESLGMRIMSLKDKPWRPTTCALQAFGRYARRNIVRLGSDQARLFLTGDDVYLESAVESDAKPDLEPGFVIVAYRDQVLGCGLYSRGRLISQVPKESRISEDCVGDL